MASLKPIMHVLISGAGIAGPTLAWFLAKANFRVTVIEKSSSILPHGQNVDFQGCAITALKKMGIMDQVQQLNTTEKGTKFINPKGQSFAPFPLTPESSASPTSPFEILRGDLAAILYKATKDHPNVTYLFGTTIERIVSNNDFAVKVELSNGSVREFDLLVAADGQWSKVRKQCFPPESVKTVPTGMYAVYFTIPRLPSDDNWWNVYIALGSRIITTRPDPHGTIRAMFTRVPRDEVSKKAWQDVSRSDKQTQGKLLRKEFEDAGWEAQRILDAMDRAPDFYFHDIQQIRMSKWSTSRVICLGDAAYAPTPLTGMGTSLAIIGAYILAGELSTLNSTEHPSKAFIAYEDKFRPFVEETQKIPSFVPGIAHPETTWQRWLLHAFGKGVSKIVAIPWIVNRFPSVTNEDGFPLPKYACFDHEGSE